MSHSIPPFGLRLPPDLKQWVEDQARQNLRSQNSEIIYRLEAARHQAEKTAPNHTA